MLLFSNPEDYMLPCLNKKLFGIECMGCGLQRSISLLIQGEFIAAFKMYPAIYSLILLLMVIIFNSVKPFKLSNKIITILGVITVSIIIGNYALKILN